MNIREKQSATSTYPVISNSAGRLDKIPLLGLQANNKYPLNIMRKYNLHVSANFQILETMTVSLRTMAVLSSRAHEQRSREIRALPPQSPRGFSALARLYYLARPTKTAMLRRLHDCMSSRCQGPFDPGKSTIVCSVRETSHFDIKSFQYKSF